jgi:hypothetical protein
LAVQEKSVPPCSEAILWTIFACSATLADSGVTGKIIGTSRFFHPNQLFLFKRLHTPNRLWHRKAFIVVHHDPQVLAGRTSRRSNDGWVLFHLRVTDFKLHAAETQPN